MKVAILCALASLLPSYALAVTLSWDRNNTDADVASYSIYACFTPGCVPAKGVDMHRGVTKQTAVGVRPSFVLDIAGKEGTVAVTAKDLSGNESGFSVPLPFDSTLPQIPANLTLQ